MPKPHPGHLISREQQEALDWLNKQVEAGKLSRPAIEQAVGLSQSNLCMILSGRRMLASRGVKAVVEYAHKLQGRKPLPSDIDPFEQLRLIAKDARPKDRWTINRLVSALVEAYSPRRKH